MDRNYRQFDGLRTFFKRQAQGKDRALDLAIEDSVCRCQVAVMRPGDTFGNRKPQTGMLTKFFA